MQIVFCPLQQTSIPTSIDRPILCASAALREISKVIMLIEAKIQPQRRAELVNAISQYVPLVRAEPGVETFYVTARKDDPNTFVFYEVYRSHAAQDFHLQQNFTKNFLATLKSAQIGDRVRVNLVELNMEGQTHSN